MAMNTRALNRRFAQFHSAPDALGIAPHANPKIIRTCR